jgi:hypothetical protein
MRNAMYFVAVTHGAGFSRRQMTDDWNVCLVYTTSFVLTAVWLVSFLRVNYHRVLDVSPYALKINLFLVTCQCSGWPLVPKIAGSNTAEAVWFLGRKNLQHAFLRRGSKAVCPMSQSYGELGIAGQIDRPFLAQFRPSLTEVSHVASGDDGRN